MTYPTVPTYRATKCRRCNGGGIWRGRGICYGCGGSGVVKIENGTRPMTAAERADYEDYMVGQEYRAARAAAREARMNAR